MLYVFRNFDSSLSGGGMKMFRSTNKLSTPRLIIGALTAAAALVAGASTSQAALTHRYSFTTDASDSIGGANGTLMNSATVSGGQLQFNNPNQSLGGAGNPDPNGYLVIPANILPSSGSATIEQWFTFTVSGFFTEAYTFTDADPNGAPGATTGQYLMHNISFPSDLTVNGGSRIVETISGTSGETNAFAAQGRPDAGFLDGGGTYMAATVIDASAGTLSYYLNGVLQNTVADPIPLSSFAFTNAYLGRSAFTNDNATSGSVDEFRIYNDAQSANQITADFAAGPNTVVGTPEPASLALLAVGGLTLLNRRRRA
jgi:Concanavalin A-like lectin/glucanases superfamily